MGIIMTKKELTKRTDLEGLEIVHKDEKILISEAYESIWQNPNHKDFYGDPFLISKAIDKNIEIV